MIFSSYEFLFLFLPIVWLVFAGMVWSGRERLTLAWLTAASLLFYAWWNPPYLLVLLLSVFGNYAFGKAILRWPVSNRSILALGITLNLLLLGYFKYTHFLVNTFNAATGTTVMIGTIILPLAISFHTFQQIAYLVDLSRGKEHETDPLRYCLFVTFFPQLIAGPIIKHREMVGQFVRENLLTVSARNVAIGLTVLAIGFWKKSVAADSIASYANTVFAAAEAGTPLNFLQAWGGALSYTMQLYFDFSGYIDMATGVGAALQHPVAPQILLAL